MRGGQAISLDRQGGLTKEWSQPVVGGEIWEEAILKGTWAKA